jgi:hypothetical protein
MIFKISSFTRDTLVNITIVDKITRRLFHIMQSRKKNTICHAQIFHSNTFILLCTNPDLQECYRKMSLTLGLIKLA